MELYIRIRDTLEQFFAGTYTLKVGSLFLSLLFQLLPFVLGGIALVALFNTFMPKERLANRLSRGSTYLPLLFASLLGAVSPIGTYALVPLIATLLKEKRLPASVLISFLIASPLINPLLFMLTLGAFGPMMAAMRLLAALVLGVSGGLLARKLFPFVAPTGLHSEGMTVLGPTYPSRGRHFLFEFKKHFKFVFRIFVLSLLVASLTAALIPANLIARVMGGESPASVLLAVILGVPLYACGGGAIPVLEVLRDMGMSKGAILAFFISGPATKFSTLTALVLCLERKVVALYLAITLVGAFLFGMVYNFF